MFADFVIQPILALPEDGARLFVGIFEYGHSALEIAFIVSIACLLLPAYLFAGGFILRLQLRSLHENPQFQAHETVEFSRKLPNFATYLVVLIVRLLLAVVAIVVLLSCFDMPEQKYAIAGYFGVVVITFTPVAAYIFLACRNAELALSLLIGIWLFDLIAFSLAGTMLAPRLLG